MVYPVPDQKTERLVKLLAEEVIPFCGVPEALPVVPRLWGLCLLAVVEYRLRGFAEGEAGPIGVVSLVLLRWFLPSLVWV